MADILPAIFRTRQPDECLDDERLHGGVARGWRANAPTEGHPGDLRALVRAADRRHDKHRPRTIHDFWRLPAELCRDAVSRSGRSRVGASRSGDSGAAAVALDDSWGLDHGTWSVLTRLSGCLGAHCSTEHRRAATSAIPSRTRIAAGATSRGHSLIVGSGNLVHNLRAFAWEIRRKPDDHAWFRDQARGSLETGDFAPLVAYERLGQDVRLAIPTPTTICRCSTLLRAPGSRQTRSRFPLKEPKGGSISMFAVQVG